MASERLKAARDAYRAFETGDRELIESLLTDDLIFYSPPDPGIDCAAYFERCWPNAGLIESYEFKRLEEIGDDEVLVTYRRRRATESAFGIPRCSPFAATRSAAQRSISAGTSRRAAARARPGS